MGKSQKDKEFGIFFVIDVQRRSETQAIGYLQVIIAEKDQMKKILKNKQIALVFEK